MTWNQMDQTHSKRYDMKKGKVKKKGALKKTEARIAQDYARNAEYDKSHGYASEGEYEAKKAVEESAKKTGGVLKRGNILQHMHGSKHASPLKQTKKELKQAAGDLEAAKRFADWADKSHAGSKMFIRTSEQMKRSKAKEKVEKTIKGGQGSKTFGL